MAIPGHGISATCASQRMHTIDKGVNHTLLNDIITAVTPGTRVGV